MAFHDAELPSAVQYGSVFGAGFSTLIHETATGHEFRTARQSRPRHRFSLMKELQSSAEARALKAFAIQRRGSQHSWKLKDWSDFTTAADGESAPTASDAVLGTGTGSYAGPYQLLKTYGAGQPGEHNRVLTLPVTGTIVAAVNGTPTTAFTTNSLGQLTFTTPPPNGQVVTAGCEFRVPVRFERSIDEWAKLRADAYGVWAMAEVACVEVLDEVEYPERWPHGGAKSWGTVAADVRIVLNDGHLHYFTEVSASGVSAFLPVMTQIPSGKDVFTIATGLTTFALAVRDDAGGLVVSMYNSERRRIGLVRSGSTAFWTVC
ncbi:MAG: DUF2460 domain-containing protein [Planctomycetota bacterium]